MKDLHKHSYSNLNLSEADLPGLREMTVGTKQKFVIEAEFTELRKNEEYDLPMTGPGMKAQPKPPKFSGRFKITALEPVKKPKGKKTARYAVDE